MKTTETTVTLSNVMTMVDSIVMLLGYAFDYERALRLALRLVGPKRRELAEDIRHDALELWATGVRAGKVRNDNGWQQSVRLAAKNAAHSLRGKRSADSLSYGETDTDLGEDDTRLRGAQNGDKALTYTDENSERNPLPPIVGKLPPQYQALAAELAQGTPPDTLAAELGVTSYVLSRRGLKPLAKLLGAPLASRVKRTARNVKQDKRTWGEWLADEAKLPPAQLITVIAYNADNVPIANITAKKEDCEQWYNFNRQFAARFAIYENGQLRIA